VWRKTGINGSQGYTDWRANYGKTAPAAAAGTLAENAQVPEPAAAVLLFVALSGLFLRRNKRNASNCSI
jgi:hypothetical protein